LAQSGSPQAREIWAKSRETEQSGICRGRQSNTWNSSRSEARKTLAEVYASARCLGEARHTSQLHDRRDHDRCFAAAKSEKDESLRREAIRQLGLVHGTSELEQLYKTETSSDVRREILQAFFLAGIRKTRQAAQGEKDANCAGRDSKPWQSIRTIREGAARDLQQGTGPTSQNGGIERVFLARERQALVAIARSEKTRTQKQRCPIDADAFQEGTGLPEELLQK